MPDAVQLQFMMGHVGVRRENPDYYKLLVMDYVLGTGPGFTDRLSSRLRDREGLAYTVTANISSSATEEPGLFNVRRRLFGVPQNRRPGSHQLVLLFPLHR